MSDPTSDQTDLASRYVRRTYIDSRANWRTRMQWQVEAWLWYALYWDRFKAMSVDDASNRGAKIFGWLGPRIARSANRTARRNMKMAFPDWSEDKVEETLKACWTSFGHIAGELPHLGKMKRDGDDPRIEVVGEEHIRPLVDAGKPIVYVSGHLSNWEVMIYVVLQYAPDAEITFRSINNPHIDRCIAMARAETGVINFAPKGIGTRELMRALSKGRSVALMNDQKFNEGLPALFFGHEAMTAPGPTRLALKYKAPLVKFATERTGPGRYRVTIQEPYWPDPDLPQDEAIAQSLRHINGWLEQQITAAPDQWFWQHNRWPKQAWKDAGVM